jgi:outer membrane lipoprotein-sorting protein
MQQPRRMSRLARWAVPAGAVATAGLVAAGTVLSGAQAAPRLPARTPAQLLASVAGGAAGAPRPMTATISESAALGFPSLPDMGGVSSALSLLSSSHTIQLWYADPSHVRVAVPASMGETDLRLDGRQVWLWQSSSQTATHLVLPATSWKHVKGKVPGRAAAAAVTPQQAARQVLAAVGPTTAVSVQQNVTVAGQAAYQLRIAPRSSQSLVGQVRIAIDAANSMPLQLQVFARGASSPAFQIGYTAISWGRPAASNFAFTPPKGAKVRQVQLPPAGLPGGLALQAGLLGLPLPAPGNFHRVVIGRGAAIGKIAPVPPGVRHLIVNGKNRRLIVSGKMTPAQLRKLKALLKRRPGKFQVPAIARVPAGPRPQVIGKGWLSVAVIPAKAGLAGLPAQPRAMAVFGGTVQSSRAAAGSAPAGRVPAAAGKNSAQVRAFAGPGPAGQYRAALPLLLKAATPVHGAWGSGRLLRTALVSVLITSKGQVLIGAVTPSVLYADAAHIK